MGSLDQRRTDELTRRLVLLLSLLLLLLLLLLLWLPLRLLQEMRRRGSGGRQQRLRRSGIIEGGRLDGGWARTGIRRKRSVSEQPGTRRSRGQRRGERRGESLRRPHVHKVGRTQGPHGQGDGHPG